MKPLKDVAARHLAAIVQSSDDAIVSKDLNGIVQSWNPAAERMFGYSAGEVVGRSITLIIPSERLPEEDMVLSRIRRGEAVDHFETVRRRKDGTLLPVSLTISPVRDEDGTIIGASKIARDISERLRAQQIEADRALLQQRLSALVDASGALFASPTLGDVLPAVLVVARQLIVADAYALWLLDEEAGVWRVNASEGLSDCFLAPGQGGLPGEPLALRAPVAVTDIASIPMLPARRAAHEAEGIASVLIVPLTIRGRQSSTLVLYYREPHEFSFVDVRLAAALGHLSGNAVRAAELYDDQRDRRERDSFLAAAGATLTSSLDFHETLRALANLAVPHIADWCTVDIVNDDGAIERVAMAHADPTRIERVRQLQQQLPSRPESPYSVESVIRSGEPLLLERVTDDLLSGAGYDDEHRRALRDLRVGSFICAPLMARGRTLGAVTFIGAESGRHFQESDIPFVQAVANRAALGIENARAFREVQEANRLKDEFLATLSHELRTPLNAIMGYTRMLRSGLMQGDQLTRALEIVERNAGALNQIIGDVLDVARITSGKLRLNLESVDLRDVLENAMETVMPAANARGVRLEMGVLEPAVVSGDPARLQQVVWNLLTNAVKFTDRGGVVSLTVRRHDDLAELVVRDTGHGIVPEFLPYLFERFRQADGGFSREHGGLGLGLAICRQLLEMHGGTITAESDGPGHGATFCVRLPLLMTEPVKPLLDVPARAATIAAPDVHPVGFSRWMADALRGVTVVVVDDDPDARSLLQTLLGTAGARVVAASSALAALQVLSESAVLPDALLVDIGMPGMDGFELIRRIRRHERLAKIPAAALTAYTRPADRARVLASGFQMHLAKPVDPTELLSALGALAGRVQSPIDQA
jgi:PAS domain S-box-containing protein